MKLNRGAEATMTTMAGLIDTFIIPAITKVIDEKIDSRFEKLEPEIEKLKEMVVEKYVNKLQEK